MAMDAFFPPHLRSIAGMIESRTFPLPGTPHPFAHVVRCYSVYDLTDRLSFLLRDDPGICRYLRWCVAQFEARGVISIYPVDERPRLRAEIAELKEWLCQHEKSAMRPARL